MSGPERIWAKMDRASLDASGAARLLAMDRPFGEYHGQPATPYVRADLIDALKAENERLRDAVQDLLYWDVARNYPIPYRVRDPLLKALTASDATTTTADNDPAPSP